MVGHGRLPRLFRYTLETGNGLLPKTPEQRERERKSSPSKLCLKLFVYFGHSGESLRTERRCKQPESSETQGAKNMFLANMSHDIRTPLNGILAVMELLGSTPLTEGLKAHSLNFYIFWDWRDVIFGGFDVILSGTEQNDLLRTGKTSGECLLALVNDILDLAKVEEKKLSLDIKPFNLEDLVHSCLDMVSLQATSRGLELLSTFEDSVPEVVKLWIPLVPS